MSRRHLLVTYAWSINNIGDMGIQAGLFTLLRQQHPGLPVKLISYLPEDDPACRHYRQVLPQYNPDGEVLPMPFFDLIGGDPLPDAASEAISQTAVKGSAWKSLQQRHGALTLEQFRTGIVSSHTAEAIADDLLNRFPLELYADLQEHFPRLAEAFAQAGFVYYNSGTTLNFGRLGVRRLFGYTLPLAMSLLLARALRIHYGIGSQSFDLIDWPVDLVYEQLFRDAEFVFCRDTDSLHYLEQKHFTFKETGFRPDTTVFFTAGDDEWAEQYLAEQELTPERFVIVILRLSNPTPTYHDPTGGTVGLERRRHHLTAMKEYVENIVAETGNKVLIAHETRGTLEKNTSARALLFDQLTPEARRQCVTMDFFWTPEQALAVMRRSALLVSVEMHSIIMGIGNAVPVLHVPYAECGRKRQMVRDMGLDECLIDLDDPLAAEKMLAATKAILADPQAMRQRLRQVKTELVRLATDTFQHVAGTL